MVEKQRGVTVGVAALIAAAVAVAVCGGLYLVTQLPSSAPSSSENYESVSSPNSITIYRKTVAGWSKGENERSIELAQGSEPYREALELVEDIVENRPRPGKTPGDVYVDNSLTWMEEGKSIELVYEKPTRVAISGEEVLADRIFFVCYAPYYCAKMQGGIVAMRDDEPVGYWKIEMDLENFSRRIEKVIESYENLNYKAGEVKYPSLAELSESGQVWDSPKVRVNFDRTSISWSLHENTTARAPYETRENLVFWKDDGTVKFRKVFTLYTCAENGYLRIEPEVKENDTLLLKAYFDAKTACKCMSSFWLTGTIDRFKGNENVPSQLDSIQFQLINKYAQG